MSDTQQTTAIAPTDLRTLATLARGFACNGWVVRLAVPGDVDGATSGPRVVAWCSCSSPTEYVVVPHPHHTLEVWARRDSFLQRLGLAYDVDEAHVLIRSHSAQPRPLQRPVSA